MRLWQTAPHMSPGVEHPIRVDAPAVDWLLGDIGGTHARFVMAPACDVRGAKRVVADGHADFVAAIRDAFGQLGAPARRAAFCLAASITGDEIRLTNRDWSFSAKQLRDALGFEELVIVNDFAANGAGMASLTAADSAPIGPELPRATGPTQLIFGPGTGLGMSALRRDPDSARVLETEAGHLGWSPDPHDDDAMIVARCDRVFEPQVTQWGRRSWEHVLSGRGLARIDAALADAGLRDPAEVSSQAQAGEARAVRAAQCFSRQLGRFASEVALGWHATGGLFITGGVIDGLGESFDHAACRRAFDDAVAPTHPHSPWFHAIALRLVTIHDIAFRGLAEIAAGRVHSPRIHLRRAADPASAHYFGTQSSSCPPSS